MFDLNPVVWSVICRQSAASSQTRWWRLSNRRDGTPRFDKQRLRVPSSSQPASHLFNPQTFYLDTQDSLVSVKSYRLESHMQSVSVSGMNYTARDVLPYTHLAPVFFTIHASLKQRNDVFCSFWAADNSSHKVPVVISPHKNTICASVCVC